MLTCLGLNENNKEMLICNLRTSEHVLGVGSKLRKEKFPHLCFIDPTTIQIEGKSPPIDPRIQELKTLLEELYRMPIPYPDLPVAIEYEGLNDEDDEIGRWAIEYVVDLHPLKNWENKVPDSFKRSQIVDLRFYSS